MNTKIITNKENIVAIADAVRNKTGKTEEFTLGEIADEIDQIQTGNDTSDATATSSEIFKNKTAYTAGGKVTGTFTIDEELSTQEDLIGQIETALEGKAASTGEDVTTETNEYTEKITQLTTAVTALENELAGKASGGSGNIATSVVTIMVINNEPGAGRGPIYYTNSNGEYVEENIQLSLNDSVTINMATNTILSTHAVGMASSSRVEGGQILSVSVELTCVITEPTATIYLA